MSIVKEFFKKSVDLSFLEQQMGYEFRDKDLLKTALTHASMTDKCRTDSYQRMEFLGDSIVGFLIAARLYADNPQDEPGELTNKRQSVVSNQTFGIRGRKLGLMNFICIKKSEQISDKVLADVYEAIIAAIYLDGGIESASDFIDRTCTWKKSQTTAHFNAVGKLKEWSDTQRNIVLAYSNGKKGTSPSQRLKVFKADDIIFDKTEKAAKKKQAKQAVATIALKDLNIS